jgi:endonuclease/exonuclease/phosphatase (EEP) superfamily protein YafD
MILGVIAAGTAVLSLVGFLGRWWWMFDLASHFRVQYFLLLLLLAVIFGLGRQPRAALGAASFSLLNLILVAALYFPTSIDTTHGHGSYRLLFANVLQANSNHADILNLIHSSDPDFIVLVETNQAWLQALQDLQENYPYKMSAVREDNYGLSVFSRFPFEQAEMRNFGEAGVPSIVVRLNLNHRWVTLIGTHPPPPKGPNRSGFRNVQLMHLADFAAAQTQDHVLLCGDLNLTPWSPHFKQVLQRGGLTDSQAGFGLQPSWPVDWPLFRVPIDHCLVSPDVHIRSRALGPAVGSDHFPLIVDFALQNKRLVDNRSGSDRKR